MYNFEVVLEIKKIKNVFFFFFLGCVLRYNFVSFLYLLFLLGFLFILVLSVLIVRGKILYVIGVVCCSVFIKFIDIVF